MDEQYRYAAVNKRYQDISGISLEELIGQTDQQVFGEDVFQSLKPLYQQALSGELLETEIALPLSGHHTSMQVVVYSTLAENNQTYIIIQATDTSEKHQLIENLKEAENKYSALTALVPFGVILVEENSIISANEACAEMIGFSSVYDLLGESLNHLFVDSQTKEKITPPISYLLKSQALVCQTSTVCKLEKYVDLSANSAQLYGSALQLITVKESITNTNIDKPVGQDIYKDPLTQLYNRLGFTKCIEQLTKRNTPFILLYLDIDNFKNINDSLGHQIGDMVLKEVSDRLRNLCSTSSAIGRLGGDEFGIIFNQPYDPQTVQSYAKSIKSEIYQPFNLRYFKKRLACSIGSVAYPKDANNANLLLQYADVAMYEAKFAGRNRLMQFEEKITKEARKRLWIEIELQKALQQNGLEVWYQPKVSTKDLLIVGAEALIRWKHPVEGYISPSEFIPVAESAGLIENIGRAVMREVFTNVKIWKQQNILPGKIAINLSPEQLRNPRLTNYMEKLLNKTQLTPNGITFELTESCIMQDSLHTLQTLNAIKNLGFSLSIDDFGTGYSSLAYLARFPVDEVKIDRAFITDLESLPKQRTVVESIVSLAKSLGMHVVAEGIETETQARLLREMQCDTLQGFYYHTPQPKHEVEKLFIQDINKRKARH